MSEFSFRSDNVDVERIMQQIRQRIREKRGTDYTEQQVRELATVQLERFLDPSGVRSNLPEHYRQSRQTEPMPSVPSAPVLGDAPPSLESFAFDADLIYRSSRGVVGRGLHLIRRLLNPLLKLFFNPTPIVHALQRQSEINLRLYEQMDWLIHKHRTQSEFLERIVREFELIAKQFAKREDLDRLNFEVLNNLVVEMTRLAIDMKNHRMRVESIAGRLDFDERRARALESVVQYRTTTGVLPSPPSPATAAAPADAEEGTASAGAAGSEARRRRRRRRGRRRPGSSGGTADLEAPSASADSTEPAGDVGSPSEPEDGPDTPES